MITVFSSRQEYLIVDEGRKKLDVLFNYDFDELCSWKHVPCRVIPPACLPAMLSPYVSSAFEITAPNEWILKGAIRAGVAISNPHLKTMCTSLHVKLPGPKKGSGKNGRIKRQDMMQCLIKHVWPGCTDEFLKETMSIMMRWKRESVDLNLLSMVSELDVDNQESFKKLKKYAMDELEAKVFGKGKLAGLESAKSMVDTGNPDAVLKHAEKTESILKNGESKAACITQDAKDIKTKEHMNQWKLTPPALRALLPGGGTIAGVFWMRWHPIKKFWRVTYPTSD